MHLVLLWKNTQNVGQLNAYLFVSPDKSKDVYLDLKRILSISADTRTVYSVF